MWYSCEADAGVAGFSFRCRLLVKKQPTAVSTGSTKQVRCRRVSFKGLLLLFSFLPLQGNAYPRATKKINRTIEQTPQDCFAFVTDEKNMQEPLVPYSMPAMLESYLSYYFLPWDVEKILPRPTAPPMHATTVHNEEAVRLSSFDVQKRFWQHKEQEMVDWLSNYQKCSQKYTDAPEVYAKKPFWGMNKRPLDVAWHTSLVENMVSSSFPNCKRRGIILRNTCLRTLPTARPLFTNWTDAGEGYPFDNLQVDILAAYEPCYVFHTTKKGDWYLVLTRHQTFGWVKSIDIAWVDKAFITKWQGANAYVTPFQDKVALTHKTNGRYLTATRIGQLLRLTKTTAHQYEVLCAIAQEDGQAAIVQGKVPKSAMRKMPVLASVHNIATLGNALLKQPYGWGGLHETRDCSMFTRDLWAPFGLFLPRVSSWQTNHPSTISLKGFKTSAKKEVIRATGVPFLTLLQLPGHILLYMGERSGSLYGLNLIWGMKTKRVFKKEGRALIGRSVIMPLALGKRCGAIRQTVLQRLTNIRPLTASFSPPTSFYEHIELEDTNEGVIEEGPQRNNPQLNCLVHAYRDYIRAVERDTQTGELFFVMKNRARIPWNEGEKSLEERLEKPDLRSMLAQAYPCYSPSDARPSVGQDPGRVRHQEFFEAIYGSGEEEIKENLIKVRWMPQTLNKEPVIVLFNQKNGAAAALMRVSKLLDKLPKHLREHAAQLSGTYKYRVIAGTQRLSPHAYGTAIDINSARSNYWRWDEAIGKRDYINGMPKEIIDIFEQNGFIWGGRWYHYDTMHFEYRPEFFVHGRKKSTVD